MVDPVEHRGSPIIPRATYRLQLRAGFGFNEAAAIAPYLTRLGVSHVYLSPVFKARPESAHGYDVTDHRALNPELGSERQYQAMIHAFDDAKLGRIVDFVPNHMGVGGADNPLWMDVLEWGPESKYAAWFDIDWTAGEGSQAGKLLAPLLGEQYGRALREGVLALKFDSEEGSFAVWAYGKHKLPIWPLSYDRILGREPPALDRFGDLFLDLSNWRPQIAERSRALKSELSALVRNDAGIRAAVEARVAAINADWRALDSLIGEQRWRVAYHGVASDEINYRRFFNINDLAGLRMELPAVFQEAHARVLRMLEADEIDGLRIDHVDGLFDPRAYLEALRAAIRRPFYLIVEKILAADEALRDEWPVQGTTGYEYLNLSLGVLVAAGHEAAFSATYRDFTAVSAVCCEVVVACKIRIMDNEMASELNALGRAAARLARQSPMTADLTRHILQQAIKQIVAALPVYRTYLDLTGNVAEADLRQIDIAVDQARRADPEIDPSAFAFLAGLLSPASASTLPAEVSRTSALRFAMKVQQYSGPVMAKGVEDTAFYRYNRFTALNEVGGAPDRFGIPLEEFHAANARRLAHWPHALLATATHDTKRGEDARARLAALGDLPEEWRRCVVSWSAALRDNAPAGATPFDRNDEYMVYQMLVGSWPNELLDRPDAEGLKAYRNRLRGALQKSLREAKRHTNWTRPNLAYEEAAQAFVDDALRPQDNPFLPSFLPFMLRVAVLGAQNSLAQTVMKLTLPGAPDIYQGCELWDFSLVDPDNRRPVDFAARDEMLTALLPDLASNERRGALFGALMKEWRDGRIKLAVIALLLALRRDEEELFARGSYEPISIVGERSDWAFGFTRALGERRLAILIARFPGLREKEPDWRARAALPPGRWTDLFSGRRVETDSPALSELCRPLPFAVLSSTAAR